MNNLIDHLIQSARQGGICPQGLQIMQQSDLDALIQYYIANPDWCLERDFPTLKVLRENFSNCEEHGIFVSKTFRGELLTDRQVYILHNCRGTIHVGLNEDKRIIPMFYLANSCKIRFVGIGKTMRGVPPAIVPVYSFGQNTLSAHRNRHVTFHIYKEAML